MLFPSVRAWECILHNCRQERNLGRALRIRSYIWVFGLLANVHLGNLLVSMLVEAGCIDYAKQTFDGLANRSECAWNALTIGYARAADIEHAFALYQEMQLFALHTSGHAFVALLKLCSRLKDMERGRCIHSDIVDRGLEHDLFVGSTLVDMHANFGSLDKATDVFEKLYTRDAVAWSALISAHVKHGHGEEGLSLFEEMQFHGIIPTAAAFVCVLKACGHVGEPEKGHKIHADLAKLGVIETDPAIGNSVVDMYATLGLLGTAQNVFDSLSSRDRFSWTALIAGYIKHRSCEKALELFDCMQEAGISQDAVTFICGLTASSSLQDAEKSQEIHAEVARRGYLETDAVVGNALVDAYASCGLLAKAIEVFDALSVRDVVSWTALITGFTKHENGEEALERFEQMQHEGILPNTYTYVCGLQACGNIGAANKGQEIHAEIARKELLDSDMCIRNALVGMYANCGLFLKAQELFDQFEARDTVSWNVLISGYANHERDEEVLDCFMQMQYENVDSNAVTYVHVIRACRALGAIEEGQELHAEVARCSLSGDLIIANALVDMYACCGLLARALEVLEQLPQRDAVSWTALIRGYARYGCHDAAFYSFERMRNEGISPNSVTFACILKVCSTFVLAGRGQQMHVEMLRNYSSEFDSVVENILIDMYAKCGLLNEAQRVFDELPAKEDVAWNALIAGYSQLGESDKTLRMLDLMTKEGQYPDMLTFVGVLNSCSHAGLIDMGFLCFTAMSEDYGINASLEHFTCMVDLLGRAGQLNQAMTALQRIPCHPNVVTVHTLLSACRREGNMELGLEMFAHATELDQEDVGTFVTLRNMYADVDSESNLEALG